MKPEVEPKPEVKPEQKPETKPEKKPEPKPEKPAKVQKTPDGMLILGAEEWVHIPAINQTFKGRVDTGATTSSISATEVVPFERDGKDGYSSKSTSMVRRAKSLNCLLSVGPRFANLHLKT
ncbi:hypothetical protein JCM19052_2644 [Vibrio sp. JCM 19052]|nr:hypothetical protein JCM19052_2644 [Vibrio sp. JCM 19052]